MKTMTKACLAAAAMLLGSITLCPAQDYRLPEGKKIYIPKDLRENDFTDNNSKWSYKRMAYTDNVVLFWEKGFGDDVSKAPELEGRNMKVDIPLLMERIETFYRFFRDSLEFILPGSKSETYRMMVMLNYSLEGTAYGGAYDNEIGALWVAPNRVQDKKMNCIAHELGHSFQSQNSCDGNSHGMQGGVFEMASQWMLWMVNPEWVSEENYHWQAFRKAFNKRFLSGENIYRSPYVLEYWAMKHGIKTLGKIFRGAQRGEDAAEAYMRMYDVSLSQMGDEFYDCYTRLVTFDFPRVKQVCKPHACQLVTEMERVAGGEARDFAGKKLRKNETLLTPKATPETFGFNVVELPLTAKKVRFQSTAGEQQNTGFRYGVVLVDNAGNASYQPMYKEASRSINLKVDASTAHAYLVVVGCPTQQYNKLAMGGGRQRSTQPEPTFPYQLVVTQ